MKPPPDPTPALAPAPELQVFLSALAQILVEERRLKRNFTARRQLHPEKP